jgi:hypothetical protein
MQHGSSSKTLTQNQNTDTLPLERKQHLFAAIGSSIAMCSGIGAIASLSIYEGAVTVENAEDIHALIHMLRDKLIALQAAVHAA